MTQHNLTTTNRMRNETLLHNQQHQHQYTPCQRHSKYATYHSLGKTPQTMPGVTHHSMLYVLQVVPCSPIVPSAHVARRGDEVDVEVQVLVLLEVRRLEPQLRNVHCRQLTFRPRIAKKQKGKARQGKARSGNYGYSPRRDTAITTTLLLTRRVLPWTNRSTHSVDGNGHGTSTIPVGPSNRKRATSTKNNSTTVNQDAATAD